MVRTAASFHRKQPRFIQQPKLLVICEDSKSSLNYLEDVARHFRVEVKVKIAHLGVTDPLNIVKKGLARVGNYDNVYCVIDRDNHLNFDEAMQTAAASNKLIPIVSNPCFEHWILLHFYPTRKPYNHMGKISSAASLLKDLKKIPSMNTYDKGKVEGLFKLLLSGNKFNTARSNAKKIWDAVLIDNVHNSSTQIHILVDAIEKLSKIQFKKPTKDT